MKRAFTGIGLVGVFIAFLAGLSLLSAYVREGRRRESSHPTGTVFVAADDTRVLVERRGAMAAPMVVFIGGTGGWSGVWNGYMDQVVALGYQAVAIDLPPFGYAYPAPSGDYTKATQGRRLLAALDSLQAERVVMVVHSIGAAPVIEAVFAEPSRFSRLVLIDPALGLDGPQTDGSDSKIQAILRQAWISRPVTAILTNTHLTAPLLRRVISEKDMATSAWIRVYQEPLGLKGESAAISKWLPEVLAGRGHSLSDDLGRYGTLNLPVTLIWGATDTITPLSQGVHLQQLIPGSKLVVVPRAGHGPQIEEPALFAHALAVALTGRE